MKQFVVLLAVCGGAFADADAQIGLHGAGALGYAGSAVGVAAASGPRPQVPLSMWHALHPWLEGDLERLQTLLDETLSTDGRLCKETV